MIESPHIYQSIYDKGGENILWRKDSFFGAGKTGHVNAKLASLVAPTVKNLPSNAGDRSSVFGWGAKVPHGATERTHCNIAPTVNSVLRELSPGVVHRQSKAPEGTERWKAKGMRPGRLCSSRHSRAAGP